MPSVDVEIARVCPVSRLTMATCAPGRGAPEESVTVPAIVPVGAWASATPTATKTARTIVGVSVLMSHVTIISSQATRQYSFPVAKQKAMPLAIRVVIEPYQITTAVDREDAGRNRVAQINRPELASAQHETVARAGRGTRRGVAIRA